MRSTRRPSKAIVSPPEIGPMAAQPLDRPQLTMGDDQLEPFQERVSESSGGADEECKPEGVNNRW
jgi:hypothetical protein